MTMTMHPDANPHADPTQNDAPRDLPDMADRNGRSARARGVVLTISTVLTGMFAGFFFTYSASVVLGLDRVDDLTYVRTFQAINDTVRNPAFAIVFFGSIPAAALAVALHRHDRVVRNLTAIGLVFILAVVGITFAGSVPLNNELATYTDLDAITAATARAEFESTWNLLNLARTALATLAAAALAAASLSARPSRH